MKFFSRCKKEKQIFLARYLLRDLKHGASKGLVLKALSSLFEKDDEKIKIDYAKARSMFDLSRRLIERIELEEFISYFSPI